MTPLLDVKIWIRVKELKLNALAAAGHKPVLSPVGERKLRPFLVLPPGSSSFHRRLIWRVVWVGVTSNHLPLPVREHVNGVLSQRGAHHAPPSNALEFGNTNNHRHVLLLLRVATALAAWHEHTTVEASDYEHAARILGARQKVGQPTNVDVAALIA